MLRLPMQPTPEGSHANAVVAEAFGHGFDIGANHPARGAPVRIRLTKYYMSRKGSRLG